MTPDNNQLTADIWNWYIFTVKESFNVYITSLHMKKADLAYLHDGHKCWC